MTGVAAKPSITAIILSFNEELHIARCIERLWPVVERIVVIDSFSTDRTVEIARGLGAEVLQNPWRNYADQFDWGMRNANIASDWTMRVDCDEYLQPALQAEIAATLPTLSPDISGCDVKLRVIFKDKFIRWGGYYRTWLTRLWRTGQGSIEQRWMDEHIMLPSGVRHRFTRGDLVDHNLKDIGWWVEKHNGYTTRQMIDFVNLKYGLFASDARMAEGGNARAKWKRFLRNGLYANAPFYLRATLYFLQRYILRLGFLDGKIGFLFHFMQGYWNMMLIDAKVDEAERHIAAHGLEAFKLHLAERHGIRDFAPVTQAVAQ